jgi:hypothetical protein
MKAAALGAKYLDRLSLRNNVNERRINQLLSPFKNLDINVNGIDLFASKQFDQFRKGLLNCPCLAGCDSVHVRTVTVDVKPNNGASR